MFKTSNVFGLYYMEESVLKLTDFEIDEALSDLDCAQTQSWDSVFLLPSVIAFGFR